MALRPHFYITSGLESVYGDNMLGQSIHLTAPGIDKCQHYVTANVQCCMKCWLHLTRPLNTKEIIYPKACQHVSFTQVLDGYPIETFSTWTHVCSILSYMKFGNEKPQYYFITKIVVCKCNLFPKL